MARRWARAAKSDNSRNLPAREHSPYAGDRTERPAKSAERGENYGAREKSGSPAEKKER
jgi:hypothetical protein